MIIIYGWRWGGAVDERGGQDARTRFFHVFWLPIVPISSHWFVDADKRASHPVAMHGKSVAAGYARSWLPVLGVGAIATGGIVPIVGGVAALGAAVYTWRWRKLTGARAIQLSDMNRAAFASRSEPKTWTREVGDKIREQIGFRWNALAAGKTPSDVARFGSDNPDQAIAAYAMLRASVPLLRGDEARQAEADAMRIVDQLRDTPEALGPYRSPFELGDGNDSMQPPANVAADAAAPSVDDEAFDDDHAGHVDPRGLVGPLEAALLEALAGDKFRHEPPLPPVDALLLRPALMSRYAVAVKVVPDGVAGLGTATSEVAMRICRRFGASNLRSLGLFVIWVGHGLGARVGKLDLGLGGDFSVRGIYVIDTATHQVTSAEGSAAEPTKRIRAKIAAVVERIAREQAAAADEPAPSGD